MVLYLAADLIWATRIKATAEAVGVAARPVRNLEMLEARLVDSAVRALILDLDCGDLALDLLRRVRMGGDAPSSKTVSGGEGGTSGRRFVSLPTGRT